MEEFARSDKFKSCVASLFAVLLFLLLFVRFGSCFARVVNCVDFVEILIRNFFFRELGAFRGDLFTEREVGVIYGFQKSERFGVFIGERRKIHRIVRNHLVTHFAVDRVVDENVQLADTRILNFLCLFFGNGLPFRCEKLARFGVENIVRNAAAGKAVRKIELFIEFISAHLYDVVTAGIEEQIVELLANGILGGNFAGTKPSVQRDKSVRFASDGRIVFRVVRNRILDHLVAAEEFFQSAVASVAQSTQQYGCGELSLPVDAYPQNALRVLLEFKPRAAVGNDRRFIHLLARLVRFDRVVHAGRTNELRNDYALRAVDDKRAVLRHEREVPHVDVRFDNFVLHFIAKAHPHFKGKRISRVAVAALLLVILRLVPERVIEEIEFEVIGEVRDRRKILEDIADPLFYERFIAFLLNLYEVRNFDDFVDFTELSSLGFAILLNG